MSPIFVANHTELLLLHSELIGFVRKILHPTARFFSKNKVIQLDYRVRDHRVFYVKEKRCMLFSVLLVWVDRRPTPEFL